MKWKQKFTFVVIPDANSQVVRFQLSAVLLIAALALLIAVTASAAVGLLLYGDRKAEVDRLKTQLASSSAGYEKIISDQNRHIGDLQTELADLSEQAKSIQNKMADIDKLESELKDLVGLKPRTGSSSAMTAADANVGPAAGTGGAELPVTDEEMEGLIDDTRRNFSDLDQLIDDMKPRLEETKDAVLKQQKRLRVTPTIWPVDSRKITSGFGVRKDPFTGRARFHAGIDFGGNTGDPIYATADGTVTYTGRDSDHGLNIMIKHGNGIMTHYSHLSKILVETGDKVSKGGLIGKMGSTGRSTGPHLHYEVFVNGTHVDPEPYLKTNRKDL